ncbi:MAG: aromatic acid exporter family protein [Vagococcus sp.]
MKIGLRTIKTVITAVLGIIIATQLGLSYPSTAGIIAILSVTNTKKSSFKVGIGRIIALLVAIIIAFCCYQLLGYTPVAFGLYLLIFIPVAAKAKMAEAIPVNSVLMTHFLNEQSMNAELVINAIYLLLIGVGLALIANLYMPNLEGKIDKNKEEVDSKIKHLLVSLSQHLEDKTSLYESERLLDEIYTSLSQGEQYARSHVENSLLNSDVYDLTYFQMRRLQLTVLEDMLRLIQQIEVETYVTKGVTDLMSTIHTSFSEENDGVLLSEQVIAVYEEYELKELPQSREEFENRARLYQLLTEIETFIEIKVTFSSQYQCI